MLEIKNNKVFVNGKETTDATLIGLAFLDISETLEIEGKVVICNELCSDK